MGATKIRRMSINMYNPADSTANTALSTSTGGTSASNDSYTSDYIALDRTKNYTITIASSTGTITNDTNRGLCFYDANKGFISGFAWRGRTDTTYSAPLRSNNIPANTAYIRFTCDNGVSSIMLAPGLTDRPYEPYGEAVWGDGSSKKRIMSRNLFDATEFQRQFVNNTILDDNGDEVSNTNNNGYSRYKIAVTPGMQYTLKGKLTVGNVWSRIYYFDSDENFISKSDGQAMPNDTSQRTITIPDNCYYIEIQSTNVGLLGTLNIMLNAGAALPYEPYGEGVWVDCVVKKRIMSRNLFDYTTMVGSWNGYINANNVSYGANDWRTTDYIPCDGTDFTLSKVSGNKPAICAYDANKRFISGQAYNSGGSSTYTDVLIHVASTAKFLRFSYYATEDPATIMLCEGTTVLPLEPYGEAIWA